MKQYCPVSKRCGACQLLAIPYPEQLEKKQHEMEALFLDVAKKDKAELLPILGMDEPFYYRNKVISPYVPGKRLPGKQAGAVKQKKGKSRFEQKREILCGMYAKGTHKVIPTDECLLENQVAKRIVLAIRQLMPKHRLEPYNEDAGKGFLRHVVVRVGHESGEVLVTLVTNAEAFPGAKSFCRSLVKQVPEITTIVQNVNTRNTNVILGDAKERTLYGPGFILDTLCGLSFRISSHSFYQVNATQTEVLYRSAINLANLQGTERILDAYCGTGTIGLVAAKALAEAARAKGAAGGVQETATPGAESAETTGAPGVIGVDRVNEAIVDARNNAKHNGISNAAFYAEDAGEFMTSMAAREEHLDVLFMDPPRAGASEEFIQATACLQPQRIVYISCNPKTQVRDVALLQKQGYRLRTIQPVDMFPHTNHVETVVLMSRKDK